MLRNTNKAPKDVKGAVNPEDEGLPDEVPPGMVRIAGEVTPVGEKLPAWKVRHIERAKKLEAALFERRKEKAKSRRLMKMLLAEDAADIGQAKTDLKFKNTLIRAVEMAEARALERRQCIEAGLPPPPRGGRKRLKSLRDVLKARQLSEEAMKAGETFSRARERLAGNVRDKKWDDLTRDEQKRLLLVDFREFCRHSKILTKKREVIPFLWNSPQRRMNNIILSLIAGKKEVRLRIAKARQWGCTTNTVYLVLWMLHRHSNMRAMAVVHSKVPYIKALIEKYLFAYKSLPEWFRQPMTSTGNQIRFANGSYIDFFSAGTKATADQVGRSETYQIQHLTEVPFWFAPEATLTACQQSLADGPNTIQIIESTPKGENEFKNLYFEAKNGDSNAIAMFVAWHEIDGNRMVATIEQQAAWAEWRETGSEAARKRGGFGEDKENRIGRFGLDPHQWLWWWYTLREKCGNNMDRMIQEHADDDITCFAVSGDTYFKRELLAKLAVQCNGLRYQWRSVGLVDGQFDESIRGYYYRRKFVKSGEYFAVLDPADGGASTSDPSVLYICRRLADQIEVVAWTTSMDYADGVVDHMLPLLQHYDYPLLVVEANRGVWHIQELRKRGYPKLYRRTRINEVTGQPMLDQFGWFATNSSRSAALQALAKYVNQGRLICGIDVLHAQMSNFVLKGDGEKYAARGKVHDDHVLVAAIACYIDDTLTNPRMESSEQPEQRTGESWGVPQSIMVADPAPTAPMTQMVRRYFDND